MQLSGKEVKNGSVRDTSEKKIPNVKSFTNVILWGTCCSSFYFFCVVLLYVSTFLVSCCDVRYDFRAKTMFGSVRLYLQLFVAGLISYLRYLCLFAYSGIQHILCCVYFVCLRLVYPISSFSGLSIFDRCPFGIL
jgi:hypothetical protein